MTAGELDIVGILQCLPVSEEIILISGATLILNLFIPNFLLTNLVPDENSEVRTL